MNLFFALIGIYFVLTSEFDLLVMLTVLGLPLQVKMLLILKTTEKHAAISKAGFLYF